jgi:uncharacterized repeat protein (TIGR01451 family)
VLVGSNLTYTITVQNLGLATATGVVAFDILPPTVSFLSASPGSPNYTTNYTGAGQLMVTFTNLGNLATGAQTNLTITVMPQAPGTITDYASCYSSIVDPLKANNSASVKTIVQSGYVPPLTLSISLAGTNVVIAWPVNSGNFILEGAANLNAPVSWSPVGNAQPEVVGGQNMVTLPIGGSGQFFRLHGTTP